MQVRNQQRLFSPVAGSIERLASLVLRRFVRRSSVLSIALVGARAIAALNSRYRGKDYPTDVLSFPLDASIEGVPLLGEVVIAPAVAERNARRFGISREEEVRKLVVHGVLHLLGYDHETDRGEMARLEGQLLARSDIAGVRLLAKSRPSARSVARAAARTGRSR